ncbi:MAG: hypothetical protein ACRELD_14130 [Longimicrobiales bacterium]
MLELLALLAAGGAAIGGYSKSRSFVRRRLRYHDWVQKRSAPLVAGGAATLVAAPLVAVLPVVGAGAAILFGLGVGAGTRAGRNDARADSAGWLPDA